jgi:hypothetical protein
MGSASGAVSLVTLREDLAVSDAESEAMDILFCRAEESDAAE